MFSITIVFITYKVIKGVKKGLGGTIRFIKLYKGGGGLIVFFRLYPPKAKQRYIAYLKYIYNFLVARGQPQLHTL